MRRIHPALSLVCLTLLVGCSLDVTSDAPAERSPTRTLAAHPDDAARARPLLPAPGTGLVPWGGEDAARWRPEAILANATSAALNEAFSDPRVVDATVAVPLRMQSSELHQFGDGQANAAPSFRAWTSTRPPVVATLLKYDDGTRKVRFRLDRDVPYRGTGLKLHFWHDGLDQERRLEGVRDEDGDLVVLWTAEWEPAWNGTHWDDVALVAPHDWADWFPVHFKQRTGDADDLKATVPADMQRLADGRDVLDPLGVSTLTGGAGQRPFDALRATSFPQGWNQQPYEPEDIHGQMPEHGHHAVTSVGKGWTWVVDRPDAPFKNMYTCFERRQPEREASAPHGGVPSGSGWHRIGDPAETILNVLEDEPFVVGFARSNPIKRSALPSGTFSYGLSDVATVRFLLPGEAFVVGRGVVRDDGTRVDDFHWYYLHGDRPVCTQEWIHPCRPDSSRTSAPTFRCQGADLVFHPDFSTWTHGVVSAGGPLEIHYDPRRPGCAGTTYANLRTDGGAFTRIEMTQRSAGDWWTLPAPWTVPSDASELELYFETVGDDCRTWDSAHGANHRFRVQ